MSETKHLKILKLIAKDHQIPNTWTVYKMLELKYGNTNLLGNGKYSKVSIGSFCFCLFVNYLWTVLSKLDTIIK